MKSFAVLASALLAATASASPVNKRIVAQEFDISDFSATTEPHGTGAFFSFKVATNQQPFQTNCSAVVPQAVGSLPSVDTTACADPTIIWSFRASGSAYTLALADAEQSLVLAKVFDAADFPVINDGSSVHQAYAGAPLFVVK